MVVLMAKQGCTLPFFLIVPRVADSQHERIKKALAEADHLTGAEELPMGSVCKSWQ
jgi:hypothetical protein